MKEQLLPHFLERTTPIELLVLHCSNQNAQGIIQTLDEHKMSAHYVLDEDGVLIKCVDEAKSAQHAFPGYWRGSDVSPNSRSIGIELSSPTLGQEPYTEAQIDKLIFFCKKLIKKYNIEPQNIVGHSDISPDRKPDPGVAFPWKRLAKEGVGLWYQPKNADKMIENDVAKLLSKIGYDVRDEETVKASAYAFCRRFLPQYVKVDADVYHLVDNILPDDFSFMQEQKFINTLKAVAYSYIMA